MSICPKNKSSKALIDVSTTTLSTIDKNENIKITAVLLNNDESNFTEHTELIGEGTNKIIKVTLSGVQKNYITNAIYCQNIFSKDLRTVFRIICKKGRKIPPLFLLFICFVNILINSITHIFLKILF